MPDESAMAGAPMPESVEAAWEEFWRLHDWGEDGGEALVNVAVRASERSRLLNPSDELLKAVALAIATASGEEYFEELFEDYCDMARAGLQAAGGALNDA